MALSKAFPCMESSQQSPIANLLTIPWWWVPLLPRKHEKYETCYRILVKPQGPLLMPKSTKFSSLITPQPSRSTSLTFSDFHRSSLSSKYLGIPLIDNSQHNSSWESLIQSLTKCLASWTFRSFNLVGCLVLLNSVLQVFPIYLFLTLATPKYVQTLLGHTKEILLAGY